MKTSKCICLLSFLFLLAACNKNRLSMQDYITYYSADHSVTIEGVADTYKFTMLPAEYIALRDAGFTHGQGNQKIYEDRLKEIKGNMYLKLQIINKRSSESPAQAGAGSYQEVAGRLQYYNFGAVKDLKCISGTDTLYPRDFAYEENYNLSDYSVIDAVFDTCSKSKYSILFNDHATGQLSLIAGFSQADFPTLKK